MIERGHLDLPTLPAEEAVQVGLVSVRGKSRDETVTIRHKISTAKEVAAAMHESLAAVDRETASNPDIHKRTRYAAKYPKEKLLRVVLETVRRSGIDKTRVMTSLARLKYA